MVGLRRASLIWICVILAIWLSAFECFSGTTPSTQPNGGLHRVLQYIHSDWDVLTRSMTRCDSVVDPKLPEAALLYLPANFSEPDSVKQLKQACTVRVEHLPQVIEHPGEPRVEAISPQGLLFLPNSYVVPGGRFNEMYGWDSYFIILGLVRDKGIDLARGLARRAVTLVKWAAFHSSMQPESCRFNRTPALGVIAECGETVESHASNALIGRTLYHKGGVGAAKTEGADPGTTRSIGGHGPWLQFGIDI